MSVSVLLKDLGTLSLYAKTVRFKPNTSSSSSFIIMPKHHKHLEKYIIKIIMMYCNTLITSLGSRRLTLLSPNSIAQRHFRNQKYEFCELTQNN